MQVLTTSEKLLLSSVGVFAISLTAIVIFCLVRKSCWLHKCIWEDEKKKKQKMDDIICFRYPPDIYPTSLLGVYRENAFRSPEEELARLFYSPLKRDSTYSSMSDRSSNSSVGFETSSPRNSSGSNTTSIGSPVTATVSSTPEHSPGHSHPTINQPQQQVQQQRNHSICSPMVPLPVIPVLGQQDRRLSMPHLSASGNQAHIHHHPGPHGLIPSTMTNRSTASAIAAEVANQRFSLHPSHPSARQQPFFTFILKYEEDNGLVHIEFIEARNLPPKEYVNQPSDAFFTLEIQPKKPVDRKKEVMRYRFVTKTIKKAGEICDFSETFLAQLAKAHLNDYIIKFSAFDQDRFGNPTEIGTTTLSFDDFKDFTTNKLVLSCSLKEPVLKRGDIMISLCFLPTAERMSVTIVKLNNLSPFFNDGTFTKQSICYVRLLLLRADTGRVIRKKKTTFQKLTGSTANQPVFNETIVFDMPPSELVHTVILALVCLADKPPISKSRRNSDDPAPDPQPQPQQHQQPKHNFLSFMNRTSDEPLFHYSDNLNLNAGRKGLDRTSSGQSRSSQGSGTHQLTSSLEKQGNDIEPSHFGDGGEDTEQQNNITVASTTTSPQSNSSGTGSFEKPQRVKDTVVGKVALGYCIKNPLGVMNHWGEMMRYPRNVITEWHGLK